MTLEASLNRLRDAVDRHITPARVRRYLTALVNASAPSTAAAVLRGPVLRKLLSDDGALGERLRLDMDFGGAGSPVLLAGGLEVAKPYWCFAHLDTISYLVQPAQGEVTPLVPYCVHLLREGGACPAHVYRFDVETNAYVIVAEGQIETRAGAPQFRDDGRGGALRPGDRVAPYSPYEETTPDGGFTGLMDNAGGVAALALAAPVLAEAGVEAMLALPDEEEGPVGAGNQTMCRGSFRIAQLLPPPELAVVADVGQAGGEPAADTRGGVENSTRLGGGAVLAEFSSLARGAVTPLDLYASAQQMAQTISGFGVKVQESNNAYSSRSDDVSLMLKTPNVLLIGYPGFNRHFDHGLPRAHAGDVMHLAKTLVYASALGPFCRERRRAALERP